MPNELMDSIESFAHYQKENAMDKIIQIDAGSASSRSKRMQPVRSGDIIFGNIAREVVEPTIKMPLVDDPIPAGEIFDQYVNNIGAENRLYLHSLGVRELNNLNLGDDIYTSEINQMSLDHFETSNHFDLLFTSRPFEYSVLKGKQRPAGVTHPMDFYKHQYGEELYDEYFNFLQYYRGILNCDIIIGDGEGTLNSAARDYLISKIASEKLSCEVGTKKWPLKFERLKQDPKGWMYLMGTGDCLPLRI